MCPPVFIEIFFVSLIRFIYFLQVLCKNSCAFSSMHLTNLLGPSPLLLHPSKCDNQRPSIAGNSKYDQKLPRYFTFISMLAINLSPKKNKILTAAYVSPQTQLHEKDTIMTLILMLERTKKTKQSNNVIPYWCILIK